MRIKLNAKKDNMSKKGKARRPTNKDFVNVINSLIQDIHSLQNDMGAITTAFDMYVHYKNDENDFQKFFTDKIKSINDKNNELQATGQDNKVANSANPSD